MYGSIATDDDVLCASDDDDNEEYSIVDSALSPPMPLEAVAIPIIPPPPPSSPPWWWAVIKPHVDKQMGVVSPPPHMSNILDHSDREYTPKWTAKQRQDENLALLCMHPELQNKTMTPLQLLGLPPTKWKKIMRGKKKKRPSPTLMKARRIVRTRIYAHTGRIKREAQDVMMNKENAALKCALAHVLTHNKGVFAWA